MMEVRDRMTQGHIEVSVSEERDNARLRLPRYGWFTAIGIVSMALLLGLMIGFFWCSQMTVIFGIVYLGSVLLVCMIALSSVVALRSISLSYLELQRKSIEASSQADTARHELGTSEREAERQRFLVLVREVVKILIDAKMGNAQNAVGHHSCR